MEDVDCPYCGKEQEINHDDGYGYEEGKIHSQHCSDCGKTFAYTTSISFYYEADKAPCMNEEPHNYEPTITHPKCFTKMRCVHCDEERDMTEEERKTHANGQTVQQYFDSLKNN
jgi:hypothetical protein